MLLLVAEAPQSGRGLQMLPGGVGVGAVGLGSGVPVRRGLICLKSSQIPTAALPRLAVAGLYPAGPVR